uniref:Uncharacterized protein n=1 Tax=Plectus sambesii TaxID=2011161 RepID=A0A914UXP1_9BILA
MTIIERLRHCGDALAQFCVETVQWQRPAPSAMYMMLVNGLFWSAVFYLDRSTQLYALIGLATSILVWDTIARVLSQQSKESTENASLLSAPIRFVWSWLYQRFGQLCIICLSCTSARFLQQEEKEYACWSAYGTVIVALVTPPWRYNEVNKQISTQVNHSARLTADFFRDCIFLPIWTTLKRIGRTLRYYLLLEWLPPLIEKIKRAWRRLVDWVSLQWHRLTTWIRTRIVDPIVAFFCAIGRFLRYWFCGHWIPPLLAMIDDFRRDFVGALRHHIIEPICAGCQAVWRAFKYVVLCHWAPPLWEWIQRRIFDPIVRAFNYVCYGIKYVVCGYWIPGLLAYLRDLRLRTTIYIKEQLILPFLAWLRIQRHRLKIFIREKILKPAWRKTKQATRAALKALKNSVLYPLARVIGRLLSILFGAFYVHAMQPAWFYCEVHVRRFKHFMLVQYIEPGWEWVREQLPEKSPFCDDSDTELKDFLPPQLSRTQSFAPSDSEASEAGFTPSMSKMGSRVMSRRHSVSSMKNDDDEDEFTKGLHFPTVRDSESSDDEFDLRPRRSSPRARKTTVRLRRKPAKESHGDRRSIDADQTLSDKESSSVGAQKQSWADTLRKAAGDFGEFLASATAPSPDAPDEADLQLKVDEDFEILDVDNR